MLVQPTVAMLKLVSRAVLLHYKTIKNAFSNIYFFILFVVFDVTA
jgi:hypothetical protein